MDAQLRMYHGTVLPAEVTSPLTLWINGSHKRMKEVLFRVIKCFKGSSTSQTTVTRNSIPKITRYVKNEVFGVLKTEKYSDTAVDTKHRLQYVTKATQSANKITCTSFQNFKEIPKSAEKMKMLPTTSRK